jgi:Flp pilus assembly protein TadG
MRNARGQATVEFALAGIIVLALIFAIFDFARAGFTQHDLDSGAADLARSLSALSGTNSGVLGLPYQATPLTPSNARSLLAHASQIGNLNFDGTTALTMSGAMTLTNGQVTIVASPNLTTTDEVTVTITAPFTPVIAYMGTQPFLHLSAQANALTPAGLSGP